MKNVSRLLMASLCLLFAACTRPGSFEVTVEPLDTPAGNESFAQQLFTVDGRTSLSWLRKQGREHALEYAVWQGDGWSEPRDVARGGDWFANWADLPGVRPRTDGGWLAWWLQKSGPDTYAYDVQLALSDDGRHWREAGTPHADGTQTEHGFVTAFDLPDGGIGLVWLDGRNTQPGGSEHQHGGHGGMTLRYGQLAADAEVRERELDGLVCDCCQTDSAWANDALVLVYRDRTEEEIRDIHAQRFAGGEWQDPVRVHADGWEIPGCPVNGPAVAAEGDFVAAAWFTAPEGRAEVRLALSEDGGRHFGAPLRVDDGRPEGRVDVLIHPQHGVLVSWLEKTDEGAEVRLRRIDRTGKAGDAATLVSAAASRAGGFPRLTGLADGGVLMSWTETAETGRQVRTARLRIR